MNLNDVGLMDLYKLRNEVQQAIDKEKKRLIGSVSVEKNEHGTIFLTHQTNGSYVCKRAAFRSRWRMWKMVQGQRGLKQGPVVVHEHGGYGSWEELDDLKIHVALGYYKDK